VRRDDTLTFQVDGTLGAAVAGFTRCVIQDRDATPFPSWNPDATETFDFRSAWREYEPDLPVINGFNAEWELFIKHLYEGTDFPWDLRAGVKGVQLAELATQSWRERRWIDIPELED
jgi:predicted dehydrogenase